MGLDTNIYRVNRKKAKAGICTSYDRRHEYIEYFSINNDVKSIGYQHKNYYLKEILKELTWSIQGDYVELTKLQAYHVLYAMKLKHKWQSSFSRKRHLKFVQQFETALHNFDWERDMMVWNWS